MAKKVNRKWIENKKYIKEWNGHQVNMMRVAKDVCLKVKWDEIVDEVQSLNKLSHSPARMKSYGFNPSLNATHLWEKTERLGKKGNLHGSNGTIRLTGNSQGGRGGPTYGVSVGMGGDLVRTLEVLIHEITHVIHLSAFYEPTIKGKRRPHDWVFNAIMLRAMEKYFGLSKSQLKPRCMGWSVGNGYAPSRQIERIFGKKWVSLEDIPKRLTKHFNKDIPQVKVKKVLTDEQKDKKIAGGFRRTLTTVEKGLDCSEECRREYAESIGYETDGWCIDRDLIRKVKDELSLDSFTDVEKKYIDYIINTHMCDDYNYFNMDLSENQMENRYARMGELWRYLNR
jgi:hypothetical protein